MDLYKGTYTHHPTISGLILSNGEIERVHTGGGHTAFPRRDKPVILCKEPNSSPVMGVGTLTLGLF